MELGNEGLRISPSLHVYNSIEGLAETAIDSFLEVNMDDLCEELAFVVVF